MLMLGPVSPRTEAYHGLAHIDTARLEDAHTRVEYASVGELRERLQPLLTPRLRTRPVQVSSFGPREETLPGLIFNIKQQRQIERMQ